MAMVTRYLLEIQMLTRQYILLLLIFLLNGGVIEHINILFFTKENGILMRVFHSNKNYAKILFSHIDRMHCFPENVGKAQPTYGGTPARSDKPQKLTLRQ